MSEENNQAMESALQTLNQLATSHSTPKNFKKTTLAKTLSENRLISMTV